MPFNVVFFTEGGENAGFGHITRCRALSDAFEEVEEKVVNPEIEKFLSRITKLYTHGEVSLFLLL